MYHKWQSMTYGSWDMECDRQKPLSFWTIFLPITQQTGKSKFWKNEKNVWRYYHLTHVYHKWKSWCIVPEIWSMTDIIFSSFCAIFCSFTPLTTQKKSKFWKKWKKHLEISSFYSSVPKLMIKYYTVLEI